MFIAIALQTVYPIVRFVNIVFVLSTNYCVKDCSDSLDLPVFVCHGVGYRNSRGIMQELADGATLADLVTAGWRPSQAQAPRIARQLASVLAHLRSRSVVHRDVKPENIVLEGGSEDVRVVLVDFGGALRAGQTTQGELLGSGTFVGTLGCVLVSLQLSSAVLLCS
jgi:serine/threonine protein kinase